MSARHGAHVEDIIEGIVIPLPLKARAHKCSQGDPPVIFQGIEDQAPEPESGHINILALTHIINSRAINMIPALSHTALFERRLLLVLLSEQMFLVLPETL